MNYAQLLLGFREHRVMIPSPFILYIGDYSHLHGLKNILKTYVHRTKESDKNASQILRRIRNKENN